jgi:hypothetical protein
MARRKERVPERVTGGGFAAFPHSVFDSVSFAGASDKAKALIFAIIRQLNGTNNGHLQLTTKWLKNAGYTCPSNNIKARKELVERGLIVQTKFGGLNMGADLFAVTWLPITNPVGLDITMNGFNQGAYKLCTLPPTKKRVVRKRGRFNECNSTVTTSETGDPKPVTTSETENALFKQSTVTTSENNVSIPYTVRKYRQASVKHRVIGAKGKSGVLTKPAS